MAANGPGAGAGAGGTPPPSLAVPLAAVVERVVKASYDALYDIRLDLEHQSPQARRRLMSEIFKQERHRLIQLYAILRWTRGATTGTPRLAALRRILQASTYVQQRGTVLRQAVAGSVVPPTNPDDPPVAMNGLRAVQHAVLGYRTPLVEVDVALDVLVNGTYTPAPRIVRTLGQTYSEAAFAALHSRREDLLDLVPTLATPELVDRLNTALRLRLLTCDVPAAYTSVDVRNGALYLAVAGEFDVVLSTRSTNLDAPWRVESLGINLGESPPPPGGTRGRPTPTSVIQPNPQQRAILHHVLATKVRASASPLVTAYTVVHRFVNLLALESLYLQAAALVRGDTNTLAGWTRERLRIRHHRNDQRLVLAFWPPPRTAGAGAGAGTGAGSGAGGRGAGAGAGAGASAGANAGSNTRVIRFVQDVADASDLVAVAARAAEAHARDADEAHRSRFTASVVIVAEDPQSPVLLDHAGCMLVEVYVDDTAADGLEPLVWRLHPNPAADNTASTPVRSGSAQWIRVERILNDAVATLSRSLLDKVYTGLRHAPGSQPWASLRVSDAEASHANVVATRPACQLLTHIGAGLTVAAAVHPRTGVLELNLLSLPDDAADTTLEVSSGLVAELSASHRSFLHADATERHTVIASHKARLRALPSPPSPTDMRPSAVLGQELISGMATRVASMLAGTCRALQARALSDLVARTALSIGPTQALTARPFSNVSARRPKGDSRVSTKFRSVWNDAGLAVPLAWFTFIPARVHAVFSPHAVFVRLVYGGRYSAYLLGDFSGEKKDGGGGGGAGAGAGAGGDAQSDAASTMTLNVDGFRWEFSLAFTAPLMTARIDLSSGGGASRVSFKAYALAFPEHRLAPVAAAPSSNAAGASSTVGHASTRRVRGAQPALIKQTTVRRDAEDVTVEWTAPTGRLVWWDGAGAGAGGNSSGGAGAGAGTTGTGGASASTDCRGCVVLVEDGMFVLPSAPEALSSVDSRLFELMRTVAARGAVGLIIVNTLKHESPMARYRFLPVVTDAPIPVLWAPSDAAARLRTEATQSSPQRPTMTTTWVGRRKQHRLLHVSPIPYTRHPRGSNSVQSLRMKDRGGGGGGGGGGAGASADGQPVKHRRIRERPTASTGAGGMKRSREEFGDEPLTPTPAPPTPVASPFSSARSTSRAVEGSSRVASVLGGAVSHLRAAAARARHEAQLVLLKLLFWRRGCALAQPTESDASAGVSFLLQCDVGGCGTGRAAIHPPSPDDRLARWKAVLTITPPTAGGSGGGGGGGGGGTVPGPPSASVTRVYALRGPRAEEGAGPATLPAASVLTPGLKWRREADRLSGLVTTILYDMCGLVRAAEVRDVVLAPSLPVAVAMASPGVDATFTTEGLHGVRVVARGGVTGDAGFELGLTFSPSPDHPVQDGVWWIPQPTTPSGPLPGWYSQPMPAFATTVWAHDTVCVAQLPPQLAELNSLLHQQLPVWRATGTATAPGVVPALVNAVVAMYPLVATLHQLPHVAAMVMTYPEVGKLRVEFGAAATLDVTAQAPTTFVVHVHCTRPSILNRLLEMGGKFGGTVHAETQVIVGLPLSGLQSLLQDVIRSLLAKQQQQQQQRQPPPPPPPPPLQSTH